MSNFEIWCFAAVFIMIALLLATYFNLYYGVYDSLTNSVIGDVYTFRYQQPLNGEHERYLAKVINIKVLSPYEINKLNELSKYRMIDENFHRSKTLVTCKMLDGTIRNFYAERATNCNRSFVSKFLFSVME
jgi:hypothetical protein